eukprot:s5012_g3.t1
MLELRQEAGETGPQARCIMQGKRRGPQAWSATRGQGKRRGSQAWSEQVPKRLLATAGGDDKRSKVCAGLVRNKGPKDFWRARRLRALAAGRQLVFLSVQKATLGTAARGPQAQFILHCRAV